MKEFLHKIAKIFLILLLITLVITLAVVAFVFISHQKKLGDEASLIERPVGQMVEVNGTKVHVSVAGDEQAEETIVVLHGIGMVDASVAMQPFINALSETYRVVYVDRPGNGFSVDGTEDKSVAGLTELTRDAIAQVGIEGEVILFAQTTGGIEACYWAATYPEEVKAIVGLDMAFPEEYAEYNDENGEFNYMMYLFSAIGVTRYIDAAYPVDSYDLYSDKQMLVRKALISKGGYTKDMYAEDKMLGENARQTMEMDYSKVPMYLFLSNPIKEPYLSTDQEAVATLNDMKEQYPDYDFETAYNKSSIELIDTYANVEYEEVAGPSALYTYIPEEMAEMIVTFLEDK